MLKIRSPGLMSAAAAGDPSRGDTTLAMLLSIVSTSPVTALSSGAFDCSALYSASVRYTERGSRPDSMPEIAVRTSLLSPTGSTASLRIRSNASPNRLSCS